MTAYRYRNPGKRRAYVREKMALRRLWVTRKDSAAVFFREWAQLFVAKVSAL